MRRAVWTCCLHGEMKESPGDLWSLWVVLAGDTLSLPLDQNKRRVLVPSAAFVKMCIVHPHNSAESIVSSLRTKVCQRRLSERHRTDFSLELEHV